jgi:hypothetical protein
VTEKKEEFNAYVYGVRFHKQGHAANGMIRYVGKSINPSRRFARHMKGKDKGILARAVLKHGDACFELIILAEFVAGSSEEAEKRALAKEVELIAVHRTVGTKHGLNLTLGGEGVRLVGEAMERHRALASVRMREIQSRPEVRKQYSELAKRRLQDPEYQKRWKKHIDNRRTDPRLIEIYRASGKRLWANPVTREKILRAFERSRQDPRFIEANRRRLAERNKDPAIRAKMAATQSRLKSDPRVRAKIASIARNLHADPSFAAKYSEGLRRKHSDPEYAKKHAGHTKGRHQANPRFGLSAKIGIALHWAQTHETNGNARGAEKQRLTLASLLDQWGPSAAGYEIIDRAKHYLEKTRTAA